MEAVTGVGPGGPLLDHCFLMTPSPASSPRTVFQPRDPRGSTSLGVPRNSGCMGHCRAITDVCSLPKPSPYPASPGAWAAARALPSLAGACLLRQGWPVLQAFPNGPSLPPCTCLCPQKPPLLSQTCLPLLPFSLSPVLGEAQQSLGAVGGIGCVWLSHSPLGPGGW